MSQALTLARPYARAAFAIAQDGGAFAAWSDALGFAARVAADAHAVHLVAFQFEIDAGGLRQRGEHRRNRAFAFRALQHVPAVGIGQVDVGAGALAVVGQA